MMQNLRTIARYLLILLLIVGCIAPFTDLAEAGRRRNAKVTLEEGVNRRGNDIAQIKYTGRRGFRNSQAQHFSMEEYLYGPGDQSRIWHRPRGERLNPRSDFDSTSIRGGGFGYDDDYYVPTCGH